MASTTMNKEGIVDFLWEWAGDSNWSRLLVQKVVSTESCLEPTDREEVFKYFLQSIGLEKNLVPLTFIKPNYYPTSKTVELVKLSEVTGVNKLKKDQKIQFAPNMTVIYGENGTGKTGYSRILKALGYSYELNKDILSNIFKESEPQSAKIEYKNNNDENSFTWNGKNRNDDLKNISVFNNNCVQISLDGTRQLIVSPIGFHLFNLISSELNALDALFKEKQKEYPIKIDWIEHLNVGTPQEQFINSLSKNSTEIRLIELSKFGSEQNNNLTIKVKELDTLNKSLLEYEIKSLNSQINELTTIIDKINNAERSLNADTWKQLIKLNKSIIELERKTQKGINEIAEEKGIEFYETKEFENFLIAAETYIKIIDRPGYPQNEDVCVYCRQPLEHNSKELLKSYHMLLNDKSKEKITIIKKSKQSLTTQVENIDTSLKLNHSSFGFDEKDNPVQPAELSRYNKDLELLKEPFIKDEVVEDSVFDFKYENFRVFISNKKKQLKIIRTTKTELFNNIEAKEKELKKDIAELKDRKYLSGKVEEIKEIISNYNKLHILYEHLNVFSTTSISRKTSQAREELISQDFNNLFQQELKALRKTSLQIKLSFGTERGTTKLSHEISNHQLLEILSEGEQKSIALAEFLTELQLDNIKAPVIFDDPVNSLDHKIIDSVANRTIKLSEKRQVVIFTHSILLFNSLLYLSAQSTFKHLNYKFYNSLKEYDYVGVITDAEEEKNKVKQNVKNIENLIKNKSQDRSEVDVAKEGFGELRSAIELCIEHEIFNGTVRRYQKNISVGKFMKVNSDGISKHKDSLNDIYDRCCGYINAHSSPEIVHNNPSLDDLIADFDEFKIIREAFIK